MKIRKTLGTLLLAGSAILPGCYINYTPKNDIYLQKQQKAEEITQEALGSVSNIYKNVEDHLRDAEKELENSKSLMELRLKEIQRLRGE